MSEFILRTSTERLLYVEALLSCIDRGTVSAQQACADIQDIGRAVKAYSADVERAIARRIDGIIAAYRTRTIDAPIAITNLVQVIDAMAPDQGQRPAG